MCYAWWMPVHHLNTWSLRRPEESTECPRAGVTDLPADMSTGNQILVLWRIAGALNCWASPQPLNPCFLRIYIKQDDRLRVLISQPALDWLCRTSSQWLESLLSKEQCSRITKLHKCVFIGNGSLQVRAVLPIKQATKSSLVSLYQADSKSHKNVVSFPISPSGTFPSKLIIRFQLQVIHNDDSN